jgi:hypothetical protein
MQTPASSSPRSSCTKCPAPAIVTWSRPRVPGTSAWKTRSAPRVIGSESEKAVRKGRSKAASASQARRLAGAAGSSGVAGTSMGSWRGPAF